MNLKEILLSKAKNPRLIDRYLRYIKLIDSKNISNYKEIHHILPKSIYKQHSNLKNNPWNKVYLSYKQHLYAHWMLSKIFGNSMWFAFNSMLNKGSVNFNSSSICNHIRKIAKTHNKNRPSTKGYVNVKYPNSNKYFLVLKDDIRISSGEVIKLSNPGFVSVIDTITNEKLRIKVDNFDGIRYIGINKGFVPAEISLTGKPIGMVSKDDHRFKTNEITRAGTFKKNNKTPEQKQEIDKKRLHSYNNRTTDEKLQTSKKLSMHFSNLIRTEEHKTNISKSTTGKKKTITEKLLNSREKIKQEIKDGIRHGNTKGITLPKVTCEYCFKNISVANYKRWHSINCKHYSLEIKPHNSNI